jgi:hypothetical protein
MLGTLAVVCAVAGSVRAQSVVFSGPNAHASPGGGTHSAMLIDGQYAVFFNDGTTVVYATTPDGVTFSAPQPASDLPENFGFSIARRGMTLGLVWAYHDSSGYSLWYREATIANASLTWGTSTRVAFSATDTRGYLATLIYSPAGTPYIAALEYGQSYTGPAGPGCGATTRYRPTHYVLAGSTWQMRSYCNNFDTILDPNSIAIAPSGSNMIVQSNIDANLSTAIVNDTGEMGEPWHMVPAVEHVLAGQLASAQSLTTATDVHLVYRDGAGAISYGRQDGTLLDNNALLADVTVLDASAREPALSRPATAAGCYVAVYAVGNTLRRRSFSGSIATLSPETTAYTLAAAPTHVSVEQDAEMAPAVVWQEGDTIKLGFGAAGAATTLTAVPANAPADGTSLVSVTSTPFHDACGNPIAAGTPVTVTASTGSIVDADMMPQLAGTQVPADGAGQVTVQLRAPMTDGRALIAAMPVAGGQSTSVPVMFGTSSVPPNCGDGVLDTASGEECDVGTADTDTCNAATCQLARCGDGYVNAAAHEDCEAGALCDPTSCTFGFAFGGGCAGCGASGPVDSPWLAGACAVLLFRRRRRK